MLQQCLYHYGITPYSSIANALHQIQEQLFCIHTSGYTQENSISQEFHFDSPINLYGLYSTEQILEAFRYASLFGFFSEVSIEPNKITWKSNSYHQRDLFFTKFRLELRELKKISPII